MKKFGLTLLMAWAGLAGADVEALYNKTCVACHASGAAGAPKTGAAEQWAPRLAKGMDTLVANAIKGVNAMPPKGMCFDCSEADMKALIEFMSKAQ
jgi:cytochrome c5